MERESLLMIDFRRGGLGARQKNACKWKNPDSKAGYNIDVVLAAEIIERNATAIAKATELGLEAKRKALRARDNVQETGDVAIAKVTGL